MRGCHPPFAGIRHARSVSLTSASRSSRPCSTRRSMPRDVTGLLIEHAWNRVDSRTGASSPAVFVPYAACSTTSPCSTTATLTPGMWSSRIRSRIGIGPTWDGVSGAESSVTS